MLDGVVTARDTTMTFCCFVLFDMFNALSCRSATKSLFEIGLLSNRYLFVAITATLGCLLAVVHLPFLQWVFQTEALNISDWIYLTALTSTVLIVSEIRKMLDKLSVRTAKSKRCRGLGRIKSSGKSRDAIIYGLEDV